MLLMLLALQTADCTLAKTQIKMTQCAAASYQRADSAMNAQWKLTFAAMKRHDATARTRDEGPGYAQTTLESQRAWIKYRDMQCSAESLQFAGGSVQPMVLNHCLARMTDDRTHQLKSLIWNR